MQIVVSDGLNADAINEQLRALLLALRRLLSDQGCHVGETDVVVQNGRVRAGYEIGGLAGAAVVVHLIGERPGTGLNTLSAYMTYGRDEAGQSRWSRDLDHCGDDRDLRHPSEREAAAGGGGRNRANGLTHPGTAQVRRRPEGKLGDNPAFQRRMPCRIADSFSKRLLEPALVSTSQAAAWGCARRRRLRAGR